MAQETRSAIAPFPTAPPWVDRVSWAWLGVVPFFVFALMFLILPTGLLVVGGFQDARGHFTLRNLLDLFQPTILSSYLISIKVSAASAIGGALVGFALAYAAITGGLPRWVRPTLMTFSGVASNFAGVPLAFAFLATLGRTGLATAYALTGSWLNIVTIGLYAQIRGDVLHNQNLGYALALGMILITGLSNAAYIWLRGRGERWLR